MTDLTQFTSGPGSDPIAIILLHISFVLLSIQLDLELKFYSMLKKRTDEHFYMYEMGENLAIIPT